MPFYRLILLAFLAAVTGCSSEKISAGLLLTNGTVYTVDSAFSVAEAIAVKDHRILAVGPTKELTKNYRAKTIKDLKGAFVYPGWIDSHCHFLGYGLTLGEADLVGTSSVEEIVSRLQTHYQDNPGPWITGRGWDQNDWEVQEFPDRTLLDNYFPDVPVFLRRIDGHAAWANTRALKIAGITEESRVDGGVVVLREGLPSGILIDNAMNLVSRRIPSVTEDEMVRALQKAEENCFQVGLTSLHDAGVSKSVVQLIDSLHGAGSLHIRINAWLSPSDKNFAHFVEKGTYQTDFLTVNTIKLFADGALGSRGARLIEPYSDDPENSGLYLTPLDKIEKICRKAYENKYAVATHCIGDAANRETLKIYGEILGGKNDRRWRIEHAQVIHPDDFHYFGDFTIIPSVQPTHATSDMYWAEQRVGHERMKGAYAYRKLKEQNGWITHGSDFPVEQINPLYGFYAATIRKDHSGYPEEGFQIENALSREDALRAMTIWAAKSGFEEHLKGSIEPGKLADFVVTSEDILSAPEEILFQIGVDATYLGGELVYEASE